MVSRVSAAYRSRVHQHWEALGIAPAAVEARGLPLHAEARRLQPVGIGSDGRDKMLTPSAARAWLTLQHAAQRDGVALLLVSAFRSIEFQAGLIRNKLAKGRAIDDILSVNAPPGCSEHHTGRAVDIGAPECPPLEEIFETTEAYRWLHRHAARFGFVMSYPKDNAEGYLYEPWHWCWHKIPD